jgi:hypothetical protein
MPILALQRVGLLDNVVKNRNLIQINQIGQIGNSLRQDLTLIMGGT